MTEAIPRCSPIPIRANDDGARSPEAAIHPDAIMAKTITHLGI
jgi:hypothetical protein